MGKSVEYEYNASPYFKPDGDGLGVTKEGYALDDHSSHMRLPHDLSLPEFQRWLITLFRATKAYTSISEVYPAAASTKSLIMLASVYDHYFDNGEDLATTMDSADTNQAMLDLYRYLQGDSLVVSINIHQLLLVVTVKDAKSMVIDTVFVWLGNLLTHTILPNKLGWGGSNESCRMSKPC